MTARQLPQTDYLSLKAAFRQLVKICGGGNASAQVTRVRQQELSNYGNPGPDCEERFAPADVIADLEAECGDPAMTRALAALSGHVLVPEPRNLGAGPLHKVTGAAMRETAEVFAELGQALDDGRISQAEDARLATAIDDAVCQLYALKAQIHREAEGH